MLCNFMNLFILFRNIFEFALNKFNLAHDQIKLMRLHHDSCCKFMISTVLLHFNFQISNTRILTFGRLIKLEHGFSLRVIRFKFLQVFSMHRLQRCQSLRSQDICRMIFSILVLFNAWCDSCQHELRLLLLNFFFICIFGCVLVEDFNKCNIDVVFVLFRFLFIPDVASGQ